MRLKELRVQMIHIKMIVNVKYVTSIKKTHTRQICLFSKSSHIRRTRAFLMCKQKTTVIVIHCFCVFFSRLWASDKIREQDANFTLLNRNESYEPLYGIAQMGETIKGESAHTHRIIGARPKSINNGKQIEIRFAQLHHNEVRCFFFIGCLACTVIV